MVKLIRHAADDPPAVRVAGGRDGERGGEGVDDAADVLFVFGGHVVLGLDAAGFDDGELHVGLADGDEEVVVEAAEELVLAQGSARAAGDDVAEAVLGGNIS